MSSLQENLDNFIRFFECCIGGAFHMALSPAEVYVLQLTPLSALVLTRTHTLVLKAFPIAAAKPPVDFALVVNAMFSS